MTIRTFTTIQLVILACWLSMFAQTKNAVTPIPVTVPEGTFEFSNLSIFHVSTQSGKQVADLNGTVANNTNRPWASTRFRLVATGHTPDVPQKRIVKTIEFNIMDLRSGGPRAFRYPLDPMPYFEVDSFRLTWLEGKATSEEARVAAIKKEKEAEEKKEIADVMRTHRLITYQVGGSTNSALVTYAKGDGGVQQKEVSVPWSETVYVVRGTVLSISAQNRQDWGRVNVRIMDKLLVLKEATSEGAYVVASTSTRIE
jgi:hypothetical protein